MNKRTVIVSGGALDEKFAIDILKSEETEFIIGADHGLVFLYEHGILPDYIVGDFDSTPEEIVSYYRERTNIPIRKFNPVKDASDTEIALDWSWDGSVFCWQGRREAAQTIYGQMSNA